MNIFNIIIIANQILLRFLELKRINSIQKKTKRIIELFDYNQQVTFNHKKKTNKFAQKLTKKKYSTQKLTKKKHIDKLSFDLNDQQDIVQGLTLQMGSDKQEITFDLDSGSSDCWVLSSSCKSCIFNSEFTGETIPAYISENSTTYSDLNKSFQLDQGSGSVAGFYGHDSLSLQNDNESNSNEIMYEFLSVTDSSLGDLGLSGLIGLGFDKLKVTPSTLFIDHLYQNNIIDSRSFMFNLNFNNQSKKEVDKSGITFGDKAIEKQLGDSYYQVEWLDVMKMDGGDDEPDQYFWTVSFTHFGIGDDNYILDASIENGMAILDSGTSLIQVQPELLQQLRQQTQETFQDNCVKDEDDGLTCNCSQDIYDTLEEFNFTLNDIRFSVPKESQMYRDEKLEICYLLVYESDLPILGDSFMKYQNVIFDYEGKQIGILKKDEKELNKISNDIKDRKMITMMDMKNRSINNSKIYFNNTSNETNQLIDQTEQKHGSNIESILSIFTQKNLHKSFIKHCFEFKEKLIKSVEEKDVLTISLLWIMVLILILFFSQQLIQVQFIRKKENKQDSDLSIMIDEGLMKHKKYEF